MENHPRWRALRPIILLLWGIFALGLTTQTDQVPVVGLMVSTIGSTEWGATVGHAGLFGALTAFGYVALKMRLSHRRALLLAMILVLLIATSTELFQTAVSGRSSSLSDLLANWLGIFIVGFFVSTAN